MTTNTEHKVTVKLFVGVMISPELRMHLSKSALWKEISIARGPSSDDLIETPSNNETYLGTYVNNEAIPLHELREMASAVKQKIAAYCASLNIETLNLSVFPQIFVS